MSIQFRKDNAFGDILAKWWQGLEDDRAGRAMLRRAHSITEVILTPAYQQLYQLMCSAGWTSHAQAFQSDHLASAAGLLAHVRQHTAQRPAEAMSSVAPGKDRPPVSELRFQRLLDAPDIDALFTGLRRVLPLMNYGVDILALATDVVNWGDAVKKQWAYGYDWPAPSKR